MKMSENYKENIGLKVKKIKSNFRFGTKPFKSGYIVNTIKGVINHPIKDVPAYTFQEDDGCVECENCEIINK
jgi:hypothetical protein